jgi:hypothetical protein
MYLRTPKLQTNIGWEDLYLLGYKVLQSVESQHTSRRNIPPRSSVCCLLHSRSMAYSSTHKTGTDMFLWNVSWLSTVYTALCRKHNSSQPPLWEPHILKYDWNCANRNNSYLLKSSTRFQVGCYLRTFEPYFIFPLDFLDILGIAATSRQNFYFGPNYLYIAEEVHLGGNASEFY